MLPGTREPKCAAAPPLAWRRYPTATKPAPHPNPTPPPRHRSSSGVTQGEKETKARSRHFPSTLGQPSAAVGLKAQQDPSPVARDKQAQVAAGARGAHLQPPQAFTLHSLRLSWLQLHQHHIHKAARAARFSSPISLVTSMGTNSHGSEGTLGSLHHPLLTAGSTWNSDPAAHDFVQRHLEKPPWMEVAEPLWAADPPHRPALQPLLSCLQRQEGEGSLSDRA